MDQVRWMVLVVKSNSVTLRGSVRRDRATTVPMWWASRRWARASRVVGSSFVMKFFLSKAPAGACWCWLGETATVFLACAAIEVAACAYTPGRVPISRACLRAQSWCIARPVATPSSGNVQIGHFGAGPCTD